MPPEFGLIGHRSWIANHLLERLGDSCVIYPKDAWGPDELKEWQGLRALYLFAGRSRPNPEEAAAELQLIDRVLKSMPWHLPVIYLSSSEVGRHTEYGRHKMACEQLIRSRLIGRDWHIVRPPAVFGPGQPVDSHMLVPSLHATDGGLELSTPDKQTEFTYVGDLVEYLCILGGKGFEPLDVNLKTFTMTPSQMRALYLTWKSYRS
jgi:hypothetical protein